MYIPRRWLLPIGMTFLFLFGFLWLLGQKATMEARIEMLESRPSDAAELRALLARSAAFDSPMGGSGLDDLGAPGSTPDVASMEALCGSAAASLDGSGQGSAAGDEDGGGAGWQASIETTKEQGNYATNSGIVWESMFVDGGLGDIAIMLYESQLNAPISISHQGGSGSSMSNSGNNEGDSTPTNVSHAITDSSTDTLTDVSTDTTVNASMGPDSAEVGGSSTSGAGGGDDASDGVDGAGNFDVTGAAAPTG